MKKVFKTFDSNGKGVLTQTKFRKALETLGFKLDINVFRQIFTLFDDDGNDRVDFNEFVEFVEKGDLSEFVKETKIVTRKKPAGSRI